MAKWIPHPSHSPAIRLVGDRAHDSSSLCYRAFEKRIGIGNCDQHTRRAAPQRLGAEIRMLGRLVSDPKLVAAQRQPSNYTSVFRLHSIQFFGAEGISVEVDGPFTMPNTQHERDLGRHHYRLCHGCPPLLGTQIAGMSGKKPMMALEVFGSVLQLAVYGFMKRFDNLRSRRLCSCEVRFDFLDEHGEALRPLAELFWSVMAGRPLFEHDPRVP